jgi:hypothetical protein
VRLVQPAPPLHERAAEIADVRYRPAERGEPQQRERAQHLARIGKRAARRGRRGRVRGHGRASSRITLATAACPLPLRGFPLGRPLAAIRLSAQSAACRVSSRQARRMAARASASQVLSPSCPVRPGRRKRHASTRPPCYVPSRG